MEIKVVNVSVEDNIPTKNGNKTYSKVTVTYTNLANNKIEAKQFFPFSYPANLFAQFKELEAGQTYSVTTEKDEKGYWIWTEVARQDGDVTEGKAAMKPTYTSNRPQYESAEERANRQVLIVKQSSLSNAIALLKVDKKELDVVEVLKVADQLTKWVFTPLDKNFEDLNDDIPL